MQDTNQTPDPNELNIQDLTLARAVIDISTARGTFKANELANVGALYNKLDGFLKQIEEQAKQAKEAADQAAAAGVQSTGAGETDPEVNKKKES